MVSADNEAEICSIPLRPQRLSSMTTLLTLAGGAVGFAVSFSSTARHPAVVPALIGYTVFLVVMLAALAVQNWRIRRNGGPPPILLTRSAMVLPLLRRPGRTVRVPVENIRSIVVLGRRFWSRLVIDAGSQIYAFPLSRIADADPAGKLGAALEGVLRDRPDGAALLAAMAERQSLAEQLTPIRAVATWWVLAIIVLVFAVEFRLGASADPLRLLDLGANAPSLVWHGEWFRLVTASLLHASPRHVFGNAVFLITFGTMLERLTGTRHMLIVLLSACLASQAVSAAAGEIWPHHIFSVGLSGGIFGLVGATGIINWRLGGRLPGGYRLPARAWLVIIAIYAVVLPLLVPSVDSWAHAGGAAAGIIAGWILCRGAAGPASLRQQGTLTGEAVTALGAAFAIGLAAALWDGANPAARQADHMTVALALGRDHAADPGLRGLFAQHIAADPQASPSLVQVGRYLGRSAARDLGGNKKRGWEAAYASDAAAYLAYRSGDSEEAANLEAETPWRSQPFAGHFATFLQGVSQDGAPYVEGPAGPPVPSLTISAGVIHVSLPQAAPDGARVYALVRRAGTLAGVLFVRLPPGFTGTQILPLPVARGAPATTPPDPLWTDPSTRIDVAFFDRRGCRCAYWEMGPWFVDISARPAAS